MALDFDSLASCMQLVNQLDPSLCKLKIGKELFTHCGPSVVEQVQHLGFDVFLDLKFHDIPNTTAKAVKAASQLGVWMVNVHASGGEKMLLAAKEALVGVKSAPLLIAVTVLTSMHDNDLGDIGIKSSAAEQALLLAKLASACELDGVVCSAHEAQAIKAQTHKHFKAVTPGIRPSFASNDDQSRIMTPAQALAQGSDYLVIGRPITKAADPLKALELIAKEINLT